MNASPDLSRRRLMGHGAAGALGLAAAPAVISQAQAAPVPARLPRQAAGTVSSYGPSSMGTAVSAGIYVGADDLYLLTRSTRPCYLVRANLRTKKLTGQWTIPSGTDGWGLTLAEGGRALYLGMYGDPQIYRADLASQTLDTTPVASLRQTSGAIFDQATGTDGRLYFGPSAKTLSGAHVHAYDPSTKRTLDLGVPSAADGYVRAIAQAGSYVVVGTGARSAQLWFQRTSGTDQIRQLWHRISTPALSADQQIYDLDFDGRRIVYGSEPAGHIGTHDLSTGRGACWKVPGARTIDQVRLQAGSKLAYFTVRPSGALWSCDLMTGRLEQLAVPDVGSETRVLSVQPTSVRGVSNIGTAWTYDIRSRQITSRVRAQQWGYPEVPEYPTFALHVDRGVAHVSGHWGVSSQVLGTSTRYRIAAPGEAKTIAHGVDGRILLFAYPSAQMWSAPAFSASSQQVVAGIQEATFSMGRGGRPRSSAIDPSTGTIIMATRGAYGTNEGYVYLIRPQRDPRRPNVMTNIGSLVRGQNPMSTAILATSAYVGHELAGEAAPVAAGQTTARIARVDLASGKLLWTIPAPTGTQAVTAMAGVRARGGKEVIFAAMSSGTLCRFDAGGHLRQVIGAGKGGVISELVTVGSSVYGFDRLGVFCIDDALAPRLRRVLDGTIHHIAVDATDPSRLHMLKMVGGHEELATIAL